MKFSEWLERRLIESLNPELEGLKRDEKLLLMSIEGRKDPSGAIYGINKAGAIDAINKLKEVRARIKELENQEGKGNIRPLPSWMQGKKAI